MQSKAHWEKTKLSHFMVVRCYFKSWCHKNKEVKFGNLEIFHLEVKKNWQPFDTIYFRSYNTLCGERLGFSCCGTAIQLFVWAVFIFALALLMIKRKRWIHRQ